MTAIGIGKQIIQHVTPAWPFPQMVVGIDDGEFRFEDRLGPPSEPVVAHR
jgi:hypothetical protein